MEETVRIRIYDGYEQASMAAARMVRELVRSKPTAVLGLATGSTPLGLYREMVRMHREEGLDFSHVTTFNLDEYVGLAPEHPQSYRRFMAENLFDMINVPRSSVHVPSGTAPDFAAHCAWYEERIAAHGGIDLQVLGLGADGHIGFNEPGTSLGSRMNVQTLSRQTIRDNARFFARPEDVPVHAVTMGVGTILEARTILLVACGAGKVAAAAAAIEGPVSASCTASALQLHRDATWLLDREAASGLAQRELYEWIQRTEDADPDGAASRLPR
jgi:glucosamine-6-phosphate deaminase